MANFNGQLRPNEIFASLYNMVISQQVFADNLSGTFSDLVDMARVDGTLYGDTKLYYATDVLQSRDWLNDAEAANLLAINRPDAPKTQAIKLDVFRQIDITVDNYLSKRAWGNEGAFTSFNSVILGWVRDTKRLYDSTTYNIFIGTDETAIGKQTDTIDLDGATTGLTGEEKSRVRAATIAQEIAKIRTGLKKPSRDYNDYGFMRSYNPDEFVYVWNTDYLAEIEKRDLPTSFHKDFVEKLGEHELPPEYFGTINGKTVTTSNGTTIRSLIEQTVQDGSGHKYHLFAGDLVPANVTLADSSKVIYPTYTVNPKVICKIYKTKAVPFMSAFEVGTSFFNPRSLTENHYLTWGHNTIEHLSNYPFITVKEK